MADPLDPAVLRQQSKLFALLDEPGQRRLLAVAATEQHAQGEDVVRQGERGDAFFIVLDGQLDVVLEDTGKPRVVARLERGSFFGEIAALLGQERSATVRAVSPVRLLRFDMPRVQDLLADYPTVRQVLLKLAIKRSEDNLQEMMRDEQLDYSLSGEGLALSSEGAAEKG